MFKQRIVIMPIQHCQGSLELHSFSRHTIFVAYLSCSQNLYRCYSSKYRTAFKTLGTTILDQNYIKD
jgi:hypothetical protein